MMYMVRHITQLPATTATIAKAGGIPAGYLAKIFRRLVKARLVRSVRGRKRGYVFARTPEEISLLELFEVVEGGPLFEDCLLRHCDCGGTTENCRFYAQWVSATGKINKLLEETTVANAAWNHPEHRFQSLPGLLKAKKKKVNRKVARSKIEVV
jgi:Rrf2 family protein